MEVLKAGEAVALESQGAAAARMRQLENERAEINGQKQERKRLKTPTQSASTQCFKLSKMRWKLFES